MADWQPTPSETPFARLGGWDGVNALAEEFYETMFRTEPALTAVHRRAEDGRVTKESREKFALFLGGWLGGPQDYIAQHGHPRLRMRHATVPVDSAMRDAWLRAMNLAMDARKLDAGLQTFLRAKFADLADFMRNKPDAG